VIGYIAKNQNETWSIVGDKALRSFRGAEEAIRTLVNETTLAGASEPQNQERGDKAQAARTNE